MCKTTNLPYVQEPYQISNLFKTYLKDPNLGTQTMNTHLILF